MKFQNFLLYLTCSLSIVFSAACNRTIHESVAELQPKMDLVRKNLGNTFIDSVVEAEYTILMKVTPQPPVKYAIENESVAINLEDAKLLQRIFLSNESYLFNFTKRCFFIPEYAIEFQGETNMTLLLSPSCKQIQIIDDEAHTIRADIDPSFDQVMSVLSKYQEKL